MKDILFTGAWVALVTPFKDNKVNYDLLKELLDFNINNGTKAIIITATTGESPTLSDEEHKEAIKFTVDYVNKRVPVIAGTGSNDTEYAIQLSKYAESVGADGLLLVTPYYNKTTQKGLIEHFTCIADSVNIPIILYNIPGRTGVKIEAETYYELSKHPRIVGTKEATGDFSLIAKTRALCGDNLHIYSGEDDQVVPLLSMGGKGVISTLSNIMPKEVSEMCEAFFNGDIKKSSEIQIRNVDIINAIFIEVNPIPIKTALNLMGYNVGPCRKPLCDMVEENLEVLKKAMKNHSLI